MKKLYCVLLAVTLLVTPYVEAKTCYASYCEFVDNNPGFENATHGQYWSNVGVTFPVESVCGGTSYVAELENTDSIWRFPFADGTYTSFTLSFRATLLNDTDNFYDELKVTVRNRDTGVSEVSYLHGNSYTSHCGLNTIYLSNNYSNANVLVLFESGIFSLHKWQIDDVSFKGYY
jgi:hypothetical protein